ncbi:hypothetical protein Fmac_015394 [Flemingia macrophylla]|uniref:Uncharacterized protein n=1 Tax=Flemingia macrophylla TaxID=520843 RepID=A0ABD1MEG6_9FABA
MKTEVTKEQDCYACLLFSFHPHPLSRNTLIFHPHTLSDSFPLQPVSSPHPTQPHLASPPPPTYPTPSRRSSPRRRTAPRLDAAPCLAATPRRRTLPRGLGAAPSRCTSPSRLAASLGLASLPPPTHPMAEPSACSPPASFSPSI